MKKSIRIIALVTLALMLCLSFAACGKKLSGHGSFSARMPEFLP
jgi:hypothetical protein